ncbi:DUF948 domain-containing protein [Bifidobacterium asteroides]|uniref:DUF948 domain-containing protein n=1 Tax=Bifidobacterium asteroides TaxID=1684 RepID=A0A6N7TUQ4_9BIFI|nr:DUF948 domain-containing protein [Bifidobacterium asteroides]MSD91369.1 DUF948 domain-containing protein [Bifidobacterium asteroides]
MDVGQIAGLIAAIAFAILAGFLIYPLIRLGKLFDQLAQTIKQAGDHVVPTLDESTSTVTQLNQTLTDVNRISAAASTTAGNLGALTDLYGSMLGKPVIKVAAFLYALRKTISSFLSGGSNSAESKPVAAKRANDGQGNEGRTR